MKRFALILWSALSATFGALFASVGASLHAAVTHHMHRSGLLLAMQPMGRPSPGDFERNRVTNPDTSALIWQPLYDWQLYPAAGQQQLNFFSAQIGAGVTSTPGAPVGSNKTISDTNMTVAGSLPSGLQFMVQAIEVYFLPGSVSTANTYTPTGVTTTATGVLLDDNISANNDVQQVYNEGLLTFSVLQQVQYRDTPLRKFPPTNWMETDSAVATTVAATSLALSQTRVKGDPCVLDPFITLDPAVNFGVSIDYPAVRALPSGNNGRIGVFLNGYLKRATQ